MFGTAVECATWNSDGSFTFNTPVSFHQDGVINVKDSPYNAVGDGLTNDTAAVLAANTDAAGKVLFFPAGTYLIDGFIPNSNTHYTGSGIGTTTLKLRTNTSSLISNWNLGAPVYDLHHITVTDMTLDGNYNGILEPATDNLGYGVFILYADYIRVERVEFLNSWFGGINIFGSRYFWITDNLVSHCGDKNTVFGGYYSGVAFDAGSFLDPRTRGAHGIVRGNIINDCGDGIKNNAASIYVDSGYDYVIAHNIIRTPKVQGIWLLDLYGHVLIQGNQVYAAANRAIHIESTNTAPLHPYVAPRDIRIVNNTVDGHDTDGTANVPAIGTNVRQGLVLADNVITMIPAGADGIHVLAAIDQDAATYNEAPRIVNNSITAAVNNSGWGMQISPDRGIIEGNEINGQFTAGGGISTTGTGNRFALNQFSGIVGVGGIWSDIIADAGTGTKFSANSGFVTRNAATAPAVNDGDTIAHGLVHAPQMAIGAMSSSTADVIVWVQSVDATNLTIAVKKRADGTPAAAPVPVSWIAEITGNE